MMELLKCGHSADLNKHIARQFFHSTGVHNEFLKTTPSKNRREMNRNVCDTVGKVEDYYTVRKMLAPCMWSTLV